MAMKYLVSLNFCHFFTDFIMNYRKLITGGATHVLERPIFGCKVPFVQIDPVANQRFVEVCGKVKRVVYNVKVNDNGTGKFFVDGNHYSEFRSLLARFLFQILVYKIVFYREILMTPFIVTGLLGKLDVNANVLENPVQNPISGHIVRARAVRHGVSLAIAGLYPEHRETLRLGNDF